MSAKTPGSPPPPPPTPVVPAKDLGISYVLLILGGYLGLHRFYLGRIGTGILYLLTGGLLGVGIIVDIFLTPGMVRKANRRNGLYYRRS